MITEDPGSYKLQHNSAEHTKKTLDSFSLTFSKAYFSVFYREPTTKTGSVDRISNRKRTIFKYFLHRGNIKIIENSSGLLVQLYKAMATSEQRIRPDIT